MINFNELTAEISGFNKKYEGTKLETPEELNAYTTDADAIIKKYPNPDGEARKTLGKFCSHLGCWVTVFGQELEKGVWYYHKSIELDPESYDIRWEYYTTLEEIVEDEEYRTPELVQDAIDCLNFCIDYCDTPQLREEHYLHYRYNDLGRVYMAVGDHKKARWCFKKSLAILPNDNARKLLKAVEQKSGRSVGGFFGRVFSFFRRERTR